MLRRVIVSVLLAASAIAPAHACPEHAPSPILETVTGQAGDAKIYFIPGLTAPAAAWDGVRGAFEATHEVHVYGLTGMGGPAVVDPPEGDYLAARADAIAADLAADGAKGATLIGHSMGGTLALMVAARAPQAVGKVVVVDQVPFLAQWMSGGQVQTAEQAKAFAAATAGAMTAGAWDAWVEAVAPMLPRQSADPAYLPQIQAWMRASDQETAATAMRSLLETDLRPVLPSVRQPILALMSYDPAIIPLPKETYLLAAQLQYAAAPNARVALVEGARHWVMHDARERFLAETSAFLTK